MKILTSLFQLFPLVLMAVKTANEAIPAPKQGASKKEMVLSIVEAACSVGEVLPNPTIQAISTLIDNIVSILNKTGIFQTTGVTNVSATSTVTSK